MRVFTTTPRDNLTRLRSGRAPGVPLHAAAAVAVFVHAVAEAVRWLAIGHERDGDAESDPHGRQRDGRVKL